LTVYKLILLGFIFLVFLILCGFSAILAIIFVVCELKFVNWFVVLVPFLIVYNKARIKAIGCSAKLLIGEGADGNRPAIAGGNQQLQYFASIL
jgi:hypothetical protein